MAGLRIALVQLGLAAAAGNLIAMGTLLVGAQDRAAALVTLLLLATILPWSLCVGLQSVPEVGLAWEPLLELSTLVLFWIPPTALHVACRWTHHQDCNISKRLLLAAYVLGGAGFLAQLGGLISLGTPVDHGWGVMRSGPAASVLFALHGLLTALCLGIAGYWCWVRLGSTTPDEQKLGARVWLLSAVLFSTAALSNYLVAFGFPVVPAGSLGNVLFLCVLAFFAARHEFLHVHREVRRLAGAVCGGVLCVWIAASIVIALASPPLLSARWVTVELAAATVGGFVLVGYGAFLRFRNPVENGHNSAELDELSSPWPEFLNTQKLRAATTPEEVSQLLVEAVGQLPFVHAAAIYRRALGAKLFRLDATHGPRLFSFYASRAELASNFRSEGSTTVAELTVAGAVANEESPFRHPPARLELSGQKAAGARPLTFVSLPVPRLGVFGGFLVLGLADDDPPAGTVALLQPLPLLLATLWHNVDLQSRGLHLASLSKASAAEGVVDGKPAEDSPMGAGKFLRAVSSRARREWPRADDHPALRAIVGRSPALLEAIELLTKAARLSVPVLLLGETGTGKELFARALHALSPRKDEPFHAFNCATIPEHLAENELFGHERGAYTGAISTHTGWLERLSGGTLFLDEVAELSPSLQAKFLRILEQREITRLGSTDVRYVDIRIVAATNRSLTDLVRQQLFREDLFHRLQGVVITLPPLRQRVEDIPLLVDHFRQQVLSEHDAPRWSPEATARLLEYPWPGNVRELRSVIFSLSALCVGGSVDAAAVDAVLRERSALPLLSASGSGDPEGFRVNLAQPLSQAVRAYKLAHVTAALHASHGDITTAARIMGVTTSNFRRLVRSLGIDPSRLSSKRHRDPKPKH
ncbi:MAG: sigma-54 dependent transcriptional regulator [Candidatus Binatia bacterium]|nr:sigma-54 dependent transcriptional regulator [Candidatus Binatia bacterium]